MTRPLAALVIALCITQTGCGDPADAGMTPEQLHEDCMAVFERKGGPPDLGKQMCDAMRKACENDPSGEECQKARRIVDKA